MMNKKNGIKNITVINKHQKNLKNLIEITLLMKNIVQNKSCRNFTLHTPSFDFFESLKFWFLQMRGKYNTIILLILSLKNKD